MEKKKNPTRYLWYAAAIGVIILFLLILLNSILGIGDRLAKINQILEYVFYGLAGALIYFLVLHPVLIILLSPSFSVKTTLDNESRKNYGTYKKVARRLLKNDDISEKSKESLKSSIRNYQKLKTSLGVVLNKDVKKRINKVIVKNAATVMVSTAISQNGRLDALTIIAVNLKMIKEIVMMCGFRPSLKNLAKLTINVFTTAMIAEGLENLDITDILPSSAINVVGEVPFIKPIASSLIQGISNALLTIRIGVVTRKYLFSDASEVTKGQIRQGALLESIKLLPSAIGQGITSLPSKIGNWFKSLFKSKATAEKKETANDTEEQSRTNKI